MATMCKAFKWMGVEVTAPALQIFALQRMPSIERNARGFEKDRFLVAPPWLTDEPLTASEDVADKRPELERIPEPERRIAHYSKEDSYRRKDERDATAIIKAAGAGVNTLDHHDFRQLLRFIYPAADYPRERRQANRAGRIEWGGGVVFERVTE